MPLAPGHSKDVIRNNAIEMYKAGHKMDQSWAAAYANARRHPHAAGGQVEDALRMSHEQAIRKPFADGGYYPPPMSFTARADYRDELHPEGVIQSEVPGRTDHLPISVVAGSYVLPADVVSGLGEGNTLAGAKVLSRMFGTGPYGTELPRGARGNTIPHPPRPMTHFAKGGETPNKKKELVPIVAAGGEFVVPPEVVKNHRLLGNGSLKRGHDILDAFVKHQRAKHIKTLQKLPGPVKE